MNDLQKFAINFTGNDNGSSKTKHLAHAKTIRYMRMSGGSWLVMQY